MRTMLISAAAAFVVLAGAPADGQTIADTLRQLRSTVGQLGGRKVAGSGTASAAAGQSTAPTAEGSGGAEMVPASVVVDDASDTALEGTPLLSRRVSTFDVRGLKLGMSPREVGRIADRQHFARRWNSLFLTSGTFEVEATRIADARLNRPVEKSSKVQLKIVEGVDPQGDRLSCEFTLEPTGPKLSRIRYIAKLDGMTPQQTAEALTRKYGAPASRTSSPLLLVWSNRSGPLDLTSPSMSAAIRDDDVWLTLEGAVADQDAAQRRLEDRARQIAASHGGGVRF